MLVWLTLPLYVFCGFRFVAVDTVYKLQLFTCIYRVEPTCRKPDWRKFLRVTTAVRGRLYDGARTIQQCLDYCNANASCVAVDIDVNVFPLRCWTQFNVKDIQKWTRQLGTEHHVLNKRCLNPPRGLAFFLTLRHINSTYQ